VEPIATRATTKTTHGGCCPARGGRKNRTGEGNEVGLLRLDEPAQETRGVEVGAQRAAAIRDHVQATRGGAVAEVHVRHLSKE
jgi:hypothetical protein